MRHRSVDILVVVTITVVAVALAFVLPSDWVPGRILTLPLVLVLPGYALLSATFPEQSPGVPERLLFSLGLSLVVVIVGGLALNWTPFGLRASSWAVLLAGVTLAASALALVRRRGQSQAGPVWLRVGEIGFTVRQGLLLGLAAAIVCGALAVSIIGAERQSYARYTQLWILPAGGANAKNAVRLGVSNMESTAMEYNLDVNVGGRVVKQWSAIDLEPNKQWESTLVLPPTTSVTSVEADLYRADAPTTIYRHVVLWLGT